MTSKVEQALIDATALRRKREEPFQAWAKRLILAAHDLPEEDWDQLDDPTQLWVNDGSRAMNKDRTIANFPGDDEEEERPRSRSRQAEPEEEEPPPDEEEGADVGEEEPPAEEEEPPPRSRSREPEEEEERPRSRRRAEPEEEERPRSRRAEPEEEERPRSRRRAEPEEEEPKPRAARNRRPAKDEEEEKPQRGKPARRGAEREGKQVSANSLMKQWLIKNPKLTTEEIMTKLAEEGLSPSRMAMSNLRGGFIHSMKVLAKAKMLNEKLAAKLP